MKPKYVALLCILIFISIIGWDVALYSDSTPKNSITQVVVELSKEWPIIPAAIGFFMGALFIHLFDTTNQK